MKIKYLALHKMIYTGNWHKLKPLLESGVCVDINSQNSRGVTLIHLAVAMGNLELVKLLINHKANADIANRYGELPLHLASKNGYLKIVHELLKITLEINKQDRYGNTAIHIASAQGDVPMVRLLLKSGVIINCVNEQGMTPLAIAEHNKRSVIVSLLENKGGKKLLNTIDAIRSAYFYTHFSRKLSIAIFALITISFSIIATIATSGTLALTILESIGASLGMGIVCLERPYREFRLIERYNFNNGSD